MGTLFQLIFSFNNLQVYKRQLKKRCFRDCQTFLESKCSWGDDIQALPHLPSYGIFKPDPCRWRLSSFCKTCFKVISSFWTNFDRNSKSRHYFESFKILTKFQIQNLFQTSKSRQKSSFKFYAKLQLILTNLQPQHHDQTSASMSWPK